MMSWQGRYPAKVCTAQAAVRTIPRGRRILIGSGAAEPGTLVEALVTHGDHLADNEIVHLLTLGPAPYVAPGLGGRFRHCAFFIGPNVRAAVHEGRADFMPVFLSEIPELIRTRRVRIDVALIQVSTPDEHGFVSLGVSVDIVRAAVDAADLVIAEVNPHMPRTLGDSFLHVDAIHHLVPVDTALPELEAEPLDDECREIGRHVATLIPDGATLQMGIGQIPNAVLGALGDRHDLGIHTEMFSDGVLPLVEGGVITGKKKNINPGKLVTSFVMGSRHLYAWVHDNPIVEMRPSSFTNDPMVIARNDGMIAVNSALAVDLTGQVAADTLLGRFFSGIGGQVDFIRGAARSRGGKPIIALRSTAKDGAVSRIRATFEDGAGVVTSRGDVHYVVTEYGIADLWGKSIRQRALSLIEIAHPDFRTELLDAAKARHYVFADQIAPDRVVPWEEARTERLPGGATVVVQPIRVQDEAALQDLLYRLSDESIRQRFFGLRVRHPHEVVQRLVDVDLRKDLALVVRSQSDDAVIAMARWDLDLATNLADVAFVVRDDWQGHGIGTVLMRRCCEIARARGLAGFTADVLATNKAMMMVFYESGLKLTSTLVAGIYHLAAKFEDAPPR